ncbi:MAG: hypothetical protein K6A14_00355 [Erysipelotrichaceae bacterium]|nr:hypothetical protein [Erysipelotrichaceae bacterium]
MCYDLVMLRIDGLKVYEDLDKEQLLAKALKKARIKEQDVLNWLIVRKSIDSRDKNDVHYLYSLLVEVKNESDYPRLARYQEKAGEAFAVNRKSAYRPVIVGAGPAGLFCALTLVENDIKPIIIEQGDSVEKRMEKVACYRESGKLDTLSNVQFGEGGAGAFSDGKLTTGINSPYIERVLQAFHRFGAPEEVTYLAKPHIGTDNLVRILVNIRRYIEEQGGEYVFNCRFEDFEQHGDYLLVRCSDRTLETDALVLALGHSARKSFAMLKNHGMAMRRKNFSVGVRIEHLQKDIDRAQYGDKTKLKLPAAQYKLVYHGSERSCYTFCMCPGGEVIASSSEEGQVVTNGMSEFSRSKDNANAALLVNVLTTDFPGDDPLEGIRFQEQLERKAFLAGGGNHFAPVQRLEDFENKKPSDHIGRIKPSYKPGYTLTDLNEILPDFVSDAIREAMPYFDRKIRGFDDPDAILTAVESRTSCPLTLVRGEDLQSSIAMIYPCGEGAGYAGGITSAAVDGIKVAVEIMKKK